MGNAIKDIVIDDDSLMEAAREALKHPDCYIPPDDELFYSWGFTIGYSRDSDIRAQSNYDCVLRDARLFVEEHGCDPDDYLSEVRSSHWGNGWWEQLSVRVLVDPDAVDSDGCRDISPGNITGIFRWVANVAAYLREQYPIYDDSDYLEREAAQTDEIITEALEKVRNDAEDAVFFEKPDARFVPDWITVAMVREFIFTHDGETPTPDDNQFDEIAKAVWKLADMGEPNNATKV